MNRYPLISIITVVCNAVQTLEKTIISIAEQTCQNKELIIIDGGSVDGTIDIINKYSGNVSFWLSEPDKGIYDAMNKGIKYAKGDYITFLNAGDYYCNKDVLESIVQNIVEVDVIYGDIFVDSGTVKPQRYQRALDFTLPQLLAFGTAVVCHQAIFVRRSIAPFYNIRYKYKAELNWYFDIIEQNVHLKWMHKDMAIVHYSLGGVGYINFKKNLFEWCRLIISRYGIRTFYKYKYPRIIINKLKYRYLGK